MMSLRRIGQTDLHVSPIGLGCMQFGGPGIVSGFFAEIPQPTVDEIIRTALDGGINWFDTAEMYGWGHSERSLAAGLRLAGVEPGRVTIATKWSPLGRSALSVGKTISARQAALAPYPVDLHQIHMGFGSFSTVTANVRAMARLADTRTIGAVGVSNFSAKQMEHAYNVLGERDLTLATNQVRLNLLHRTVETDGILETARRLGVTLIAYSPLAGGMLTGKFHADRSLVASLPRLRRLYGFNDDRLTRTTPLIDTLRGIAHAHDVTPTQVALAWLITAYGDTVVAIPGASKPHHAREAAGSMEVRLTDNQMARLGEMSSSLVGVMP